MRRIFGFLPLYAQAVCYCLLVAMIAACSDDAKEIIVDSYLQPDVKAFSFGADGTDKLTIRIESSADWTVEYGADWLTELESTSSSLTIGATANDKQKVRTATITLKNSHDAKSTVTVNQGFRLISSDVPYFFSVFNTELVISSSGEYAAYMSFEYDANGWPLWSPAIINMRTGEVTAGPAKADLQQEPIACCVTDEGGFIMQMPNGTSYNAKMKPVMFDVNTGLETAIDDGGYGNVAVQGISEDGQIMVGYVESSDYIPCKWVNGRLELLSIPLEGIIGSMVYGAVARGCSPDGSIIYGSEWNTELFSPVVWKNGKMSYVGADMVKLVDYTSYNTNESGYYLEDVSEYIYPTMSSKKQSSPDGRYLASTYRGIYYLDETARIGYWTYYPAYYDLENKMYTVLENVPGGSGISMTDDGLFFYRDENYVGYVLNTVTEKSWTVNEWLRNDYGLVVPENSMILSVSTNRKVVFGYQVSYIGGNPFEMYWVAALQ